LSISLIILSVLMLGVVFVNGWTDAPNAIATAVSTRAITPAGAVKMAVVFNFLGAFVMTLFNARVAETLGNIVNLKGEESGLALAVLASSMLAIVLWATGAWYFGIPTSESHSLIAGITGGAIALKGLGSINQKEWTKVIVGLGVSSILGFGMGYVLSKLIEVFFKNKDRLAANIFFNWAQRVAAAAMAFAHGAQDGQKFMGTFLLGIYIYNSKMVSIHPDGTFEIPVWLIIVCSFVMGLGTSVGGYRIIKSVGMDMVKLSPYQGFAADSAASLCLILSSLLGLPVSTTHTKTTAIMGVGASRRLSCVNWKVVSDMAFAWILTFPGCALLAYVLAKIFIKLL
jgi:PiT family inorganic phosphate transporter